MAHKRGAGSYDEEGKGRETIVKGRARIISKEGERGGGGSTNEPGQ